MLKGRAVSDLALEVAPNDRFVKISRMNIQQVRALITSWLCTWPTPCPQVLVRHSAAFDTFVVGKKHDVRDRVTLPKYLGKVLRRGRTWHENWKKEKESVRIGKKTYLLLLASEEVPLQTVINI